MSQTPNFDIENGIPFELIAGTDEAGRGPLCGPVVAAAVIIPARKISDIKINDSKKMTAAARDAAYDWIMKNCIVGVGQCSPDEIDEMNILRASLTAMRRAIDAMPRAPEFVLVDGNKLPELAVPARAVVKGDAKSLSIAASSIIAKVTRDRIMQTLAAEFPEYGWDKNAGYPTRAHLTAIEIYGINAHYRKSFSPVAKIAKGSK